MVPAFRDYTGLLPVNLRMVVFFDDEGTKEALSEFDLPPFIDTG